MRAIFVGSNSKYSGKSLVCICLGKILQEKGVKVGYFKPFGTLPCISGDEVVEEDAQMMKEHLNLEEDLADISPVVRTHEVRTRALRSEGGDMKGKIMDAYRRVSGGKDVLLIGGGRSMEEGRWLGFSTQEFIGEVGCEAIMIERYDEEHGVDQALAWKERLGERHLGLIMNRLNPEHVDHLKKLTVPYLEKNGVRVLGMIRQDRTLSALSVKDIVNALGGQAHTALDRGDMLVENFMVGAMNLEAAASRFRKVHNKAVITGGDRIDLQVAALESSTRCLILTGGMTPHPLILSKADELNVPVVVVQDDTLKVVEKIDDLVGRPRMREPEKIQKAMELFRAGVDLEAIGL